MKSNVVFMQKWFHCIVLYLCNFCLCLMYVFMFLAFIRDFGVMRYTRTVVLLMVTKYDYYHDFRSPQQITLKDKRTGKHSRSECRHLIQFAFVAEAAKVNLLWQK